MAANRAGAHAQFDAGLFRGHAGEPRARLMIDSTNLGRLLPAGKSATEPDTPYTAHLSDERVDLNQHWKQIVVPQPTLAGSSLPFDLSVTTPGAQMEGTYSDLLTLELSCL